MDIHLQLQQEIKPVSIYIPGSKSETNRLLLLQALYPGIEIHNASESDDSRVMRKALEGNDAVIDIGHAGTAMRFLTAYFSLQEGREVLLTGSQRMKERPIGILVEALRTLGATIEYTENQDYPPLKIIGQKLTNNKVTVKANVSSQYISALLLIGGRLENGLELILDGEITSRPYIDMTLELLDKIGIKNNSTGNKIIVAPNTQHPTPNTQYPTPNTFTVESDWSSASYFYSVVALSREGAQITLSSFRRDSLQGDRALLDIYKSFGVETLFSGNTITLTKTQNPKPKTLELNLNNTPDLAQTIAVTCFGLGIGCHLQGLHTLKIKETNRLAALKAELEKLEAKVSADDDSLHLEVSGTLNAGVAIKTYNDHRMAMAFAPLAVKVPLTIKDAGVVTKSYPAFWQDFERTGFSVSR